ncbi:MAG: amidase [Lyngbya sp. HA4199-MV5]|jgi:amidase|nr:amidase [Lyngbya sp. HA4199-MV5]
MNSINLAFAPALEQANLVRQREISPLELVELYLHRIEQFNGQLGSYVTVAAEQAIADAKAKTEAIAHSTDDLPPFFGVPISIKDLNAVAGLPCAYGVKLLKKRIATEDDGVVTRIKQAGFILLGKTATSEVGTLPYTEPDGFPPARNPWHLDYTPGGSSGGAAAAVAAGLCAIAQGSDGGGSIRGPASCCGLVGIKPSRGRVTHAPYGDRLSGISTSGPIGRTVADAAALLDVMSGYTTGDPYWLPDPATSFLSATQAPLGQLRIAFATTIDPVGTADAPCQQAVLNTVQLLQSLGHVVEPGCPDVGDLIEPFTIVWQSVLSEAGIPFIFLGKMNRWLLNRSRFQSSGKYLRAVSKMQIIARRIVTFFDTVDVLVLPTYLHTTIRVGEWAQLRPAQTMANIIGWVAPCPPFNATGQPVITIPAGFDPRGLPIGVQLIGRPAAEATLITLAAQLEAANPWSQHRPPFPSKD